MSAPGVREKHVHVERRDARDQDWDQLLEAISEMEGVIIAHRDDGSVDLFWKVSALEGSTHNRARIGVCNFRKAWRLGSSYLPRSKR